MTDNPVAPLLYPRPVHLHEPKKLTQENSPQYVRWTAGNNLNIHREPNAMVILAANVKLVMVTQEHLQERW